MIQAYFGWVLLSATISLFLMGYLFVRFPFRPSQYIVAVYAYSFYARPMFSGFCDYFLPRYMYTEALYIQGVILGCIYIPLLLAGLAICARKRAVDRVVDYAGLATLSNWMLVGCLVVDALALMIYGRAFLPNERTTGLGLAAPGSQVFFAVVTIMTGIGVAITIFLAVIRESKASLTINVLRLAAFFLLSMIFIQRGALLNGIVLGLFLSALHSPKFYLNNIWRSLGALASIFVVAFHGRAIITSIVNLFTGGGSSLPTSSIAYDPGIICQQANYGSQEHDQAWPAVISYVNTNGPDWYMNLFASIVRPFLTSGQRDELGLLTSVDNVNIYNDAATYLTRNFGFSLSSFQYHFYSAGHLSFVLVFAIGLMSSLVENRMSRANLTLNGFLVIFILYQSLLLLNGAIDEQLRWSVLSSLLAVMFVALSRVRFLTPRAGQGT